MRAVLLLSVLCACTASDDDDTDVAPDAFPEPDAWGGTTGPGLGAVSFTDEQLFTSCAWLQGDPARDSDHHNHVVVYDGYLVMPWAPEDGPRRMPHTDGEPWPALDTPVDDLPAGIYGGGISLFDISDPCAPVKVGEGWSPWMRESHTLGFATVDGRDYVAVDFLDADGTDDDGGGGSGGGVGFWDITDRTQPVWVSQVHVPEHSYPDSYRQLTLSVTWQGRYIYAPTATAGVHIIDAADPLAPTVVGTISFVGPMVSGTMHVWGNTAMVSAAGVSRVVMLDVSDPVAPQPVPGGDFYTNDGGAKPVAFYFANVGSRYGLFARSDGGGGPLVYNMTDPTQPTFVGAAHSEDGDGGYVFQHGNRLFQGESNFGAIYDFTDPTAPVELARVDIPGDLDTVTPVGNVAFVAVDDGAVPGQATGVFPWSTAPDTDPPQPGMTSPRDGATGQALTSRVGVAFDEMMEPRSAFPGSFRVATRAGRRVEGTFNVAENLVNFSPLEPLAPDTTYDVTLPANGLVDVSGNAIAADFTFSFTTAKD